MDRFDALSEFINWRLDERGIGECDTPAYKKALARSLEIDRELMPLIAPLLEGQPVDQGTRIKDLYYELDSCNAEMLGIARYYAYRAGLRDGIGLGIG